MTCTACCAGEGLQIFLAILESSHCQSTLYGDFAIHLFPSNHPPCIHKVAGLGSDIGPDLSKVATRLSRQAILEALVAPQARLTEGYGLLVGKLKNGRDVSGAIVKATDEHYEIKSADGKVSRVSRKDLASETLTLGRTLRQRERRGSVSHGFLLPMCS